MRLKKGNLEYPAGLVGEYVTLDLGVVSSSPMGDVDIT